MYIMYVYNIYIIWIIMKGDEMDPFKRNFWEFLQLKVRMICGGSFT